MLWTWMYKIRKYNFFIKFQIWKVPTLRTKGFTSLVPHTSLHCIFLDYDNTLDVRLKEELQFLQEEFQIGNFYVFETRFNGRHAVCIDALRLRDVKEIVDFSNCDKAFKKSPAINEYTVWVLRHGKKGERGEPQFIYKIESPFEGQNPQSLAHANYLSQWGLKIDLKNPVGANVLPDRQEYNTQEKDDIIYDVPCKSCKRLLPIDFEFCPYCGIDQREGQ
jgi:hypothetical protein